MRLGRCAQVSENKLRGRSAQGAMATAEDTRSEEARRFGALLRGRRLEAGLTQAALAERAGLSVRAIQHLEAGLGQPYPDTARRLADALALTASARVPFEGAARSTPRRSAAPRRSFDVFLCYGA